MNDADFLALLKRQTILDPSVRLDRLAPVPGMEHHIVQMPDEFLFLHETAIIEFHGTLFAAWYNNRERELIGFTPIRERRSNDGGRTWTPVRTIAGNEGDRFLYCPPVFGVQYDTLYLFLNRMVEADHIYCMDLYKLDEKTGKFGFEKTWPIPFKLNTNLVVLPNGKLFLPGRIAEKQDEFPLYPAGLISDSGRVDGEWRPVWFSGKRLLPGGEPYGHAECSAVVAGQDVYVFCREDTHAVPLFFVSHDCAEHWEGPIAHDIPFINSKIYSGTLSDGRNYVIGNLPPGRRKLAIFFSEPGTFRFTSGGILHQDEDRELHLFPQWSYPVAHEADGKLYVIYTMQAVDPGKNIRGAVLSVLPLKQ